MPDEIAAQRTRLSQLAALIEKELDESSPLGQMIQQRNAIAGMWENSVHDILENLQEIRDDYSAIRRDLNNAAQSGSSDTDRILKAIENASDRITAHLENGIERIKAAIEAKIKAQPPKRKSWLW